MPSSYLKGLSTRPIRYAISNRKAFPGLDAREYLRRLFGTPAHIVQLREKDLAPDELGELARAGADFAAAAGKLFVVNTRLDVALRAGAHGLHLTSEQILANLLERALAEGAPEQFFMGQSVHTLGEALEAEQCGAEYLLFSPVFKPISKQSGHRPTHGLSGLKEVTQCVEIPVLALGGAGPWNADDLQQAGAAGFAGITWAEREMRGG